MSFTLAQQLLGRDGLDANERRSLVESARRLGRITGEKAASLPLKGRHVAIADGNPGSPSAQLFERAAVLLGARVSRIGAAGLTESPDRSRHTARMLGSLYDAVDCVSFMPELARELQDIAGVPFFLDLGGAASPLRALLPATPEGVAAAGSDETMMHLVQAVLIETVA